MTSASANSRAGRRIDGASRAALMLLLLMLLTVCLVRPARADDNLRVFYAGPDGSVKTALELAPFRLVTDVQEADVFVLNGQIPNAAAVRSRLSAGVGLVLILGPDLTQEQT